MKKVLIVLALALSSCATTGEPAVGAKMAVKPTASEKDMREAMSHYLSSVVLERTGDLEGAIAELRQAADLSPESTRLQVRMLGAYYLNQDYENAAVMAERAVAKEPDSVVLQIWRGRIYFQLDDFDKATEAFQHAIRVDPNNAVAYDELRKIEEESNDLVGAIGVYEKMLELAPDSAVLHYQLGLNLLEIEDAEGAERELKRALALSPELNGAHYMLGVLTMQDERYREALGHFGAFRESDRTHVQTRVNIAGIHARQGRDTRAIDMLTRIIEGPLVGTEHHILRAFAYLKRGESIKSSLAAAPNGAPLVGTLLQALVRKMIGEPYRPLIESLDEADGDLDFEGNVYLNGIVSIFGEETGGDILVRELRALKREGIRSRVMETVLARTFMSMGRDEEAVEVLEDVLAHHGPDKWLHYYLASVNENLKRHADTEDHLRACLEFDRNDPDVLNFLGYFLAERDRKLDEAEELLTRALQIDPENGFYLDSLGWVYYRQGKGAEAVEHIRRAIRVMSSDDAVLRDHLGDAYLIAGEIEKAVAEWRRARRLDPELEGVQKKIDRYLPRIGE